MTIDFGTDLSCLDDLTDKMAEVSGLVVLAESCVRRLTTPRGRLIGEPNYGTDIRLFLSKAMTQQQRQQIPGRIRQELLKEEEITAVEVRVTVASADRLSVDIRCATGSGPFSLVIDVGAAGRLLATATVGGVLRTLIDEAEAA